MKRLIRKAGNQIELFHTTSSQVLLKIKESGAIQPNEKTGVTSNGLESIDVSPEERTPSGNKGGVYLGTESVLNWYRDGAVDATFFDTNLPNIPVDIKVSVDTDSLLPDYDDLVVELEDPDDKNELENLFNNTTPKWQTSLDQIEQVVHEGPIDVQNITGIRFISDGILFGDLNEEETMNYLKEIIQFDTWLSFNNAITQLEEAGNKIKSLEILVAFSRLKKNKRG